jgi:hypothetical protein
MPYRIVCADCDYNPRILKFEISAHVIADNHTQRTGHPCGVKEEELAWSVTH